MKTSPAAPPQPTLAQPSTTTEPSGTSDPAKPEAKDGDGSLAAGAKEGEAPLPAAVVPEAYTFTAPEGYEVDPTFIEKATPVLKELGIPQEGAQKLFDIVADRIAGVQSDMIDHYESLRKEWRSELTADKALGDGKGALSDTTNKNIAAAITALPEALQAPFRDAMNLTGAGDNPAFVRAMNALGSLFREGRHVSGKNPSPLGQVAPNSGPKSAAQAIFPHLPSAS